MLHPAAPRGRSKRYVPLTTFTYFSFQRAVRIILFVAIFANKENLAPNSLQKLWTSVNCFPRVVPITRLFTHSCKKKCQDHFKIGCWLGYGTLSLYKNALMFITTVGVPFLIKLDEPGSKSGNFESSAEKYASKARCVPLISDPSTSLWTDESFPTVDSSGSVFNDPSDLRALSICLNWSARPFPSQWQFPF